MYLELRKVILIPVLLLGTFFLAEKSWAWVDPVEGQNIFAPLNTSSIGQTKLGGLVLNVGNATYGLIVRYGFVGIGVERPTAMLEVGGDIKGDNLVLNSEANKGVLKSREIINGEKIKTNEICFTKQGMTEDCRSDWPEGGNGSESASPDGSDENGVYDSMYYVFSGGSSSFGLGSFFGYPIDAYRDARKIYADRQLTGETNPLFYGEIKYIGGERYTRAVAGTNPFNSICDSGYVKGTEASCQDGAGVYGIKVIWGDYPGSRGYLKASNYLIGYPEVGSSLLEPWGVSNFPDYGNYVYPLLPDQTLLGQNIYNRSNIDVLNWRYKALKEVDFTYLPSSQLFSNK